MYTSKRVYFRKRPGGGGGRRKAVISAISMIRVQFGSGILVHELECRHGRRNVCVCVCVCASILSLSLALALARASARARTHSALHAGYTHTQSISLVGHSCEKILVKDVNSKNECVHVYVYVHIRGSISPEGGRIIPANLRGNSRQRCRL